MRTIIMGALAALAIAPISQTAKAEQETLRTSNGSRTPKRGKYNPLRTRN